LALASESSPLTKAHFVSEEPGLEGQVARLDLVLKQNPFSAQAMGELAKIRQSLDELTATDEAWRDVEFFTTGVTPGIADLKAVTQRDRLRIQILTSAGVLVVLLLILKRPVVCLYLVFTVVWSYLVTLGITEWVFASIYGPTFQGLSWKTPIFLFVLLVAIGEDYNIYLATRVFEEQARRGRRAGLRAAIIRTGGIITSCGLIMAGTFCAMMTGTLRGMVELGFALSLGVLLDTFVVRPILVPAFLALGAGEEPACREDRANASD
jgi:RND superfamily putative drug exporter